MSHSIAAEPVWAPATFFKRGVAVPFTTPALAGGRARFGQRGLELVVPHPAGARGVYILAWSEVADSCTPTLHDLLLIEKIATLRAVSPREIRRLALAIAAEGAAGRAAREAAIAAVQRDTRQASLTSQLLARMLLEQTNAARPSDADHRMSAVQRLAPLLARPVDAIASDLEQLAAAYATLGLGGAREAAACRRMLAGLERFSQQLADWTLSNEGVAKHTADGIRSAAETTIALAQQSLASTEVKANDLISLLRELGSAPAAASAVKRELTRCEWLLDGWDHIRLVWQLSTEAGVSSGTFAEMALAVPVMPKEAEVWGNVSVSEGDCERLRQSVRSFEDWRAGSAVFGLIARNERIRALAA